MKQLTPTIYELFFHNPPLCPNFKNKIPPPLILGGRGGFDTMGFFSMDVRSQKQ